MHNKKRTLLWSFHHGNADPDQASYIFGTMHVRDSRVFAWRSQLIEKMADCEAFGCEMDLDAFKKITNPKTFQPPDDFDLRIYMGFKKYQKLKNILKKAYFLDLELFVRSYPMIIINYINDSILSNFHQLPLDLFLWEEARKMDMELIGVETVEEQLATFQKISMEDQVKNLWSIGKNIPSYRKKILKMIEYYENCDVRKLYKVSKKSLGSQKRLLLYNRNHLMTERIILSSGEKRCFFAIGAGHLFGRHGILSLMKNKAYRIRPISLLVKE